MAREAQVHYDLDKARKAVGLYETDHFTEAVLTLREALGGLAQDDDFSRVGDEELAAKCAEIRQCDQEMVHFLGDMVDETKWRLSYESHGVRVSLEDSPDKLIRVRCEGECENADVFTILACLLEVDLYPEWMPGVDEAVVTHKYSKFKKRVRVSGPKPWPIKRDEEHVVAYGDVVDCSQLVGSDEPRYGVAVCLKPAPENEVERTKGRHQVDVLGGWFIEALDQDSTHLTLIARIDPHMKYMPNWAVNFVVRNLAYLFIPMVCKQADAFRFPEGRHLDRVEDQPDVYRELQNRLDRLEDAQGGFFDTGGGCGILQGIIPDWLFCFQNSANKSPSAAWVASGEDASERFEDEETKYASSVSSDGEEYEDEETKDAPSSASDDGDVSTTLE